MDEPIGLHEALCTNRAIRRFRPDPIPDTVLSHVLEAATRAPNGSNQQRWRFVVIRDADQRRRVGEVYRRAMQALVPTEMVASDSDPLRRAVWEAGHRLAEHIGTEPPVLILVCQEGSAPPARPVDALYAARSRGASIYPAVQNLLLAWLRAGRLPHCRPSGVRGRRSRQSWASPRT